MTDTRKVPSYLSATAQRWAASVIDGAGDAVTETDFALIIRAAEALDKAETARRRLARDGIIVPDRFGQIKAHPACALERDSRAAFCRICAQLGLDAPGESESAYRGNNGRRYRT